MASNRTHAVMLDMLSLLACLGCAQAAPLPAPAGPAAVDVELVLAVDISQSMDEREFALQRAGYVEALRHPDFIKAVRSGTNGRVALAYFEWAGTIRDDAVIAWQVIDDSDSANAFADRIAARPFRSPCEGWSRLVHRDAIPDAQCPPS